MRHLKIIFLTVCLLATAFTLFAQDSFTLWHLYLEQPGKKPLLIKSFRFDGKEVDFTKVIDRIQVSFNAKKMDQYWYYDINLETGDTGRTCYVTLQRQLSTKEVPYHFSGKVDKSTVFRQSPHNPAVHVFKELPVQPIPLVAIQSGTGFEVLLSNVPAFYDNYTTQIFDVGQNKVSLSFGDNGFLYKDGKYQKADELHVKQEDKYIISPHYFNLSKKNKRNFNGLYFTSAIQDHGTLRELINLTIAKHWSKPKVDDLLGATFFSTAYMNLRLNETGNSRFWVVPAIDYSNKQYSRDAFWISMVLPKNYSAECYRQEASWDKEFIGAERQLFTLVWAYRNYREGIPVDTLQLRKILNIVESRAMNGYYSGFSENVKVLGCWQGQADLIAYEKDDAIANNQGLFVTALMCAEKLGVKPKVSIKKARLNYERLFNPAIGALSMSLFKDTMLAADALMGDLLANVYLGKPLLPTDKVLRHYETMKRFAKTPFGFKFFCNADGSYLKQEQYDSPSFKSAITTVIDGDYQCGGSWYLYDMHLLMAAYLHGAKDAEDLMIWRTKLEFEAGNTTHEYINTKTGEAHKPNMGWNAGVYGLWAEIVKQGRASDRFFREIDKSKSR